MSSDLEQYRAAERPFFSVRPIHSVSFRYGQDWGSSGMTPFLTTYRPRGASMRYMCTLHATDKGRRTAEQLGTAFVTEYGQLAVSQSLGASTVVTAEQFPARNTGVIRSDGSIVVSPHLFHSTSGTSFDLSKADAAMDLNLFVDDTANTSHAAPFVVIRTTPHTMEVAQDFVGSARCFVYHDADIAIATNSLQCAEAVLGREVDWQAVTSYAACGWVQGNRTFDPRFRMPAPSERIRYSVEGAQIQFDTTGDSRLDPAEFSGLSIQDIAQHLEGVARSIAGSSDEQFRLGLSGGRDSRVMAALFLRVGANIAFNTTNNYDDETAIAQRLLYEAGFQGIHKINDPAKPSYLQVSPIDSARALSSTSDGLFEPTYIGLRPLVSPDPYLAWQRSTISGAAGEMVHGHYYPPENLVTEPKDRAFYVTHLLKRVSSLSLATKDGKAAFEAELRADLDQAPAFSDEVKILDYFYLYERQRRWSGVSSQSKTVAPMLVPPFALASFDMPTSAIRSNSVPRALAETFMPSWKGIDYFSGGGAKVTSNRPVFSPDDVTEIVDFVTSFEKLGTVIDMEKVTALRSGDALAPARRDAFLKRALALACVVERAEQKPSVTATL